jgi:hypothetical protein
MLGFMYLVFTLTQHTISLASPLVAMDLKNSQGILQVMKYFNFNILILRVNFIRLTIVPLQQKIQIADVCQ